MRTPKRIKKLENLATEMVGDGKSPDLFFVTCMGVVVAVTRVFSVAHWYWSQMADHGVECLIENRRDGVVCDASIDPDTKRFSKKDADKSFWRRAVEP